MVYSVSGWIRAVSIIETVLNLWKLSSVFRWYPEFVGYGMMLQGKDRKYSESWNSVPLGQGLYLTLRTTSPKQFQVLRVQVGSQSEGRPPRP